MKPDSAKRILDAYDECFELMGYADFPAGLRHTYGELNKGIRLIKQARTRRGLEAILLKQSEPSNDQLQAMVARIRLLPYALRKALPEAAKKLPAAKGGRPRVLTPQDHKQITAQIAALLATTTLSIAVGRMADQYGVSKSTIRKVWQARTKPSIWSDTSST